MKWINLIFFLLFSKVAICNDRILVEFGYSDSKESLSTKKIWQLHPGLLNSHRKRWAVKTELFPSQLIATENDGNGFKTYSPTVESIILRTEGLFRSGPGWYSNPYPTNCTPGELEYVISKDEVQSIAKKASKNLHQIVLDNLPTLKILMGRQVSRQPDLAEKQGRSVFDTWKKEVLSQWMSGFDLLDQKISTIRSKQPRCKGFNQNSRTDFRKTIEMPSDKKVRREIVDAPAIVFDGFYTLRVSVDVGGKRLNGRFLVDPSLSQTVISPTFLKEMGIKGLIQTGIIDYSRRAQKINWGAKRIKSFPVYTTRFEMSGVVLPLSELWLAETNQMYEGREYPGRCCDGAIGLDVLALIAIRFNTFPTHTISIFEKDGFTLGESRPWVQADFKSDGRIMLPCKFQSKTKAKWVNLIIDFNRDASKLLPGNESLVCDRETVIKNISSKGVQSSGLTLGRNLLFGFPIVYDYPNGRLWLPMSAPSASDLNLETSKKLSLRFLNTIDGRVLHFSSPKYVGTEKHPMIVQSIAGFNSDKLSDWTLRQILGGRYGSAVKFTWVGGPKRLKEAEEVEIQLR